MIAVIIPTLGNTPLLSLIRDRLAQTSDVGEVLLTVPRGVAFETASLLPGERIVYSDKKGRGHQMYQALLLVKSDIVVFLHDDTILPSNWTLAVKAAIGNGAIGGGFGLSFDDGRLRYKVLAGFARPYYWLTGEIWGDRALFVDLKHLLPYVKILDVPLMEDVILSKWMHQKGRVAVLEQKVITSTGTFVQRGFIRHIGTILFCRLLFALGFGTKKIYDIYYRRR